MTGFHLTFVFDPERTPDVRTVCGPDPASIPTRAEVGKMRVVVGYCYRDEALNRVNAHPARRSGDARVRRGARPNLDGAVSGP